MYAPPSSRREYLCVAAGIRWRPDTLFFPFPRCQATKPPTARVLLSGGAGAPAADARRKAGVKEAARAGAGGASEASGGGRPAERGETPCPPKAGGAKPKAERTSRAAEWAGEETCRGRRPYRTKGDDRGGTTPAPTRHATVGRRNRSHRWAASVYKTLVTQSDCNWPDLQTLKRHQTRRPSAGRWRRAAARVGVVVRVW